MWAAFCTVAAGGRNNHLVGNLKSQNGLPWAVGVFEAQAESIRVWPFRFDLDWQSTKDLGQFSITESFVWDVNISCFLAVKW
uniref:Uncharacterized protein n=1 Tax=Romanomermis culicivorax TaxID=13658 RepID=A0A915K070_ROMCU